MVCFCGWLMVFCCFVFFVYVGNSFYFFLLSIGFSCIDSFFSSDEVWVI